MTIEERIKSSIRDVQDYPKPGIIFKDITPVLANAALRADVVKAMVAQFSGKQIDAVVGVEARGFILGAILAHELSCEFIPVRKAGKLPYQTRRQRYDLEYGSAEIEIHVDAIKPGMQVLIHDDLLATGGTANAAATLVNSFNGIIAGFSFLVNLEFLPGRALLQKNFGIEPKYLIQYNI